MPDTRFFAVCLSNHAARGTSPWKWSEAYPTAKAARVRIRAELRDGNATLGFLVVIDPDGTRRVPVNEIRPEAAKDIIGHYCDLLELVKKE
jgi:hypothetical protein